MLISNGVQTQYIFYVALIIIDFLCTTVALAPASASAAAAAAAPVAHFKMKYFFNE